MSNHVFAGGNQSHKPHRLTRGLRDLPGIPDTGQRFSLVCGSTILELGSGRIRRESDYWNRSLPIRFHRRAGASKARRARVDLGISQLDRGIDVLRATANAREPPRRESTVGCPALNQ
jgi:hypothetical protein